MSDSLQITFEELRQKGLSLTNKAAELQTQLDAIRVVATPDGIWTSNAATTYQGHFDRWSASQTTMIQSLQSLGDFLVRRSDAFNSADGEGLRGDGIN